MIPLFKRRSCEFLFIVITINPRLFFFFLLLLLLSSLLSHIHGTTFKKLANSLTDCSLSGTEGAGDDSSKADETPQNDPKVNRTFTSCPWEANEKMHKSGDCSDIKKLVRKIKEVESQ